MWCTGLLLAMVPDVLGCLPIPARTPALPTVSQLVDLVCGSGVALSVLPPVCLFIHSKKKCTCDGARSNQCFGACGVKKQRGILQQMVPVMSCLHQCAHPWKLPLHALQTLCLLQRSVALFLCPFSPTAQEEQIKSISHKDGRMWFLNDPSWELPSLLTSGGQKYELCRTCLPRRTGVKA